MARYVGKAIRRKEDPRLVSGVSSYVDDISRPGMLYMEVVRSIHAHARIERIDGTRAGRAPGVHAVVTGEEIAANCGPLPVAASFPELRVPRRHPLATGRVRFVGEPVAVVVATDRYAARDAADALDIDYAPLPAVVDPEKALEPEATILHEQWPDNIANRWGSESGAVDEAFEKAEVIVRQRFINQRLAPVAMETRGVAASLEMPEELVIWSSTQIPHLLRTQIAVMLGIPENRVRVIAPEVGGAFGSKLNVYAEEALVPYMARKTGRPVKWIESRRENMAATTHGRDQINDVELALKKDGTILGLKLNIIADLGAYHQLLTPMIPVMTGMLAPGAYRVPALRVKGVAVFTNKMSTDAYRGAGRPEATYLIERIIDIAAPGAPHGSSRDPTAQFSAAHGIPLLHIRRPGL